MHPLRIGTHLRQHFFDLRVCIISWPFFVLCQCFIARNVAEHSSSNCGVLDFYAACCINDDELNREFCFGDGFLKTFGFGLP